MFKPKNIFGRLELLLGWVRTKRIKRRKSKLAIEAGKICGIAGVAPGNY